MYNEENTDAWGTIHPRFCLEFKYNFTYHTETATVKVIDDESDLEEEEHNEGI